MAESPNNLGTAYVEIVAKLDEYDRQIAEMQQNTTQAMQRIERSAQESAGGIREVGRAAESNQSLIGGMFGAYIDWLGIQLLARRVATRFRLLGGVVAATSRAFAAFGAVVKTIVLPATLLVFLGDFIRLARSIPSAISSAVDAIRNMTFDDVVRGITSAYTSMGNLVSRIPILGSAMQRTISEVSNLFGGPHYLNQIEEANKAIKDGEDRLMAMARAATIAGDAIRRMNDMRQADARRGAMVGVDGVDQIDLEEQFRVEDINRVFQDISKRRYEGHLAAIADLRQALADGDIDQDSFDVQHDEHVRQRLGQIERLEAARLQALDEAARTRQKRIEQHLEEERVVEMEKRMANARAVEALQDQIVVARLNLEDRGFDAQAEAIRLGYQRRIAQAERDGHNERIALMEELSRLRIEQIRKNEQEEIEASMGDRVDLESVRRRLERSRLDDPELLRRFDINARFDEEIERARKKRDELAEARADAVRGLLGTPEGAERSGMFDERIREVEELIALLETLRQVELDAARGQMSGRHREITGARIAFNDQPRANRGASSGQIGGTPQEVRDKATIQAVEVLTKIETNTRNMGFA